MNAWIISDIHANLVALDRALAIVDDDPAPIVILGDLLTYGPDPRGVLARLAEREPEVEHWILGNHDQMYLGLLAGTPPRHLSLLPDWLRSSIDWTLDAIGDAATFLQQIPFEREVVDSGILLAHANPWGNWRYVEQDEDCYEAARTLARRGISVGVFGHTHRARFFTDPPRTAPPGLSSFRWEPPEAGAIPEVRVLNPGSVGQPRNRHQTASILRLRGSGRAGSATLHVVDYDLARHLDRLEQLALPASTLEHLTSFFSAHLSTAS